MAQLVLGVAGAAVGSLVGAPQIGWMIGSAIGGMLSQKDTHTEGPRVGDRQVTSSTLGTPMALLYGTARIGGNIIHCSEIREVATTETQSGKGGPKASSTTYTYNVDLAVDLCAGVAVGIRKIWSDGKLIVDNSDGSSAATILASQVNAAGFKFYPGTEVQLPDPTLEALGGVGNVPAYRGRAYVVFSQLDCPGGRIPQLTFEVVQSGALGGGIQLYSTVKLPPNFNGIFSSVTKNQSMIFNQYGDLPDLFPYMQIGQGFARNAGQLSTQKPISWYPFGFRPVQTSGNDPTAVAIRIRETGVFDLVSFSLEGLETAVSGVQAASGGSIPAIQYAAYDDSSGAYALAFSSPSRIEVYPGGITIPDTGEMSQIAFFDGVVFKTDTRAGATYIDRYSATSGELLESTSALQNLGAEQLLLCATSDGVYALKMGVGGLRIFRITSAGWDLVYHALSPGFTSPQLTLYAGENFAIVGATSVVDGSVDFKLVHYAALVPSAPLVADIILDQCERAGLAPGDVDVSGIPDTLSGYPIARASSARANIEPLLKAYFIDPVEVDGKLKFIKRANQSVVASISFDDLAAADDGGEAGDPFPLVRTQEAELPRTITVPFIDISADYQSGAEQSIRQATGSINDVSEELPICTTSDHAKQVADVLMFDAWSARNKRSGQLTRQFSHLTPGDIVDVEYPRGTVQSRLLTSVSDSGSLIGVEAVDANAEIYQVTPPGSTPPEGQTVDPLPTPSQLVLLDTPILRDADDNAGIYVALAGLGATWRGAELYVGKDDASLAISGSVSDPTPMGFTEGALGAWVPNTIDETNTVVVSIGPGVLSSATRDGVISGTVNACVIGAPGRWEVLQFIRAVSLGGGRWLLSGLKRGQRGTEAYRVGHQASDTFVLLNPQGMLRPLQDVSELGQSRHYRSVSRGLSLSSASSVSGVNSGVGLKPFTPIDLRSTRSSNGDIVLTFGRRTRLAESWLTGVVPLGEAGEHYELDVVLLGTVKRTIKSDTQAVTYTLANQYEDYGAPVTSAVISVYQLSESVGRGTALTSSIVIGNVPGGGTFPGGDAPVLFPALVAGTTLIAYAQATYGGTTSYKVFESTDDGVGFTQLPGQGAPITGWSYYRAGKSDGVYVSMQGESFSQFATQDFYITRGVAGSSPVVTGVKFSRPYLPVAIASDGSKFVAITQGNKVFTSTDGLAWTDRGTMSGTPFIFTMTADPANPANGATNYGAGATLVWAGSRWFLTFTSGLLYYTTDANAVTGWTQCTLPVGTITQHTRIASAAGVLFLTGISVTGGTAVLLKSVDNGANWTITLNPASYRSADVFNLSGQLVSVGYEFAATTKGSSDNGATWWSVANGQSFVDIKPQAQAGGNIVIAVLRPSPAAGEPPQKLMYSSDGFSFTDCTVI